MNTRFVVSLLCLAAAAYACGPRPHTDPAATAAARTRMPNDPALASSLDVSVGTGVRFAMHVTNTTDRKLELNFPSGQTHDFAVLDAAGREVWRWSADRMFTQALQNRLVDSRETLTYEETWQPGDARGVFTAVGTVRSDNYPVETRVEFTLP